jgi:hypothetical protein
MFTLLQKRALFENRCRSFVRVHIPVKISIFDRTCCKIWMRTRRRSEAARQLKRPRSKYFLWKNDEFFGNLCQSYTGVIFTTYHSNKSPVIISAQFLILRIRLPLRVVRILRFKAWAAARCLKVVFPNFDYTVFTVCL